MFKYIGLLAVATAVGVIAIEKSLLLSLIIVLGQGHFILTYIYQYKKGKITKKYLYFYPLFFIITFSTIALFYQRNIFVDFFTLAAGMIFVFHYFNDEFHLSGLKRIERYSFGLGAVLFSFLSVFISMVFNIHYIKIIPLVILSLLLFSIFIYKEYSNKKENRNISLFVFVLLNVFIPMYLLFTEKGTLVQLWGFIILFHYLRWYIYYYLKFKNDEKEFLPYLVKIFTVNIIVIFLYILYSTNYIFGTYLTVFFNQIFFYGWTLMHIIFTLRKEDSPFSVHD
ncbi:MAG: hypothetical protein K9M10_04285 [Candidatus Pacebacteria bacterium]|nr:hypothetical protein [Candidatus Paceibacterota bacterium]MCF7857662.1 hypothetical protein [Candidatus Paceibacterota bacterium]